MTIRIIEAEGPPDVFGRAIGAAVGQSFHTAVLNDPEFQETEAQFGDSPYLAALRDFAERHFPAYCQELDAMAETMDIAAERLFLWNCRGDLRFPPETAAARLASLSGGCTTLMAPGQPDMGRPAIVAHNEDGGEGFMAHRYWLRARPDDGPGFESFLYPGMLAGHSIAVNGEGLIQTINNIRADDLKPGVPRHFICRAVLDAETIPDAMTHLARKDRASGFHHTLAAVGEMTPLSVEAPASGTIIRPVDRPQGHANHLLDDAFDGLSQVITGSSRSRQDAVDGFLADGGDPTDPEAILFQRNDDGSCVLRCPGDGGDDYGCTLATAVFRIHADHIAWTVHAGPDDRDTVTGTVAG